MTRVGSVGVEWDNGGVGLARNYQIRIMTFLTFLDMFSLEEKPLNSNLWKYRIPTLRKRHVGCDIIPGGGSKTLVNCNFVPQQVYGMVWYGMLCYAMVCL
ncbi:hypothetical protein HZH66_004925 [Vespula vulgaris]|uniref:Uncharacterized protein n=1 Tax=Vespula vulgaris TaxID=7454 RepID=A0A834K9Q1_VESVU|nr:hypothetical protein HZH66_004925 [Vespula vulgaris]